MLIVKDLMSHELYTLKPTDTVHQAREFMLEKRIRHIPIVDEQNKFVGLLTKRDVLAASVSVLADLNTRDRDELESNIPVGEIMITEVVVAQEDTLLIEAARFMLEQKQGCLPVFSGSKLIGILTEADFLKLSLYLMRKMAEFEDQKY